MFCITVFLKVTETAGGGGFGTI